MFRNQNQPDVQADASPGLRPAGFQPWASIRLRTSSVKRRSSRGRISPNRSTSAFSMPSGSVGPKRGQSPFGEAPPGRSAQMGTVPFSARPAARPGGPAGGGLPAVRGGQLAGESTTAGARPPGTQRSSRMPTSLRLRSRSSGRRVTCSLGTIWPIRRRPALTICCRSAGLSPQSGPLADDARLAADTLLRRLPIDVELAESPR